MLKQHTWNNQAEPDGSSIAAVLYEIRTDDLKDGLLFDSLTVKEIEADADRLLTFDALVTPFSQLERKMNILQRVMERAGDTIKPTGKTITAPFKKNGVSQIAVVFDLSDGQTITIYFHNPDTTPTKLKPTDELISWKWTLNKKDITIVVAPEKGKDISVQEISRRVMKLAEKNSKAFARANEKSAARAKEIEDLKAQNAGAQSALEAKQKEVSALEDELAQARKERADAEKKAKEQGANSNQEDKGFKEWIKNSKIPTISPIPGFTNADWLDFLKGFGRQEWRGKEIAEIVQNGAINGRADFERDLKFHQAEPEIRKAAKGCEKLYIGLQTALGLLEEAVNNGEPFHFLNESPSGKAFVKLDQIKENLSMSPEDVERSIREAQKGESVTFPDGTKYTPKATPAAGQNGEKAEAIAYLNTVISGGDKGDMDRIFAILDKFEQDKEVSALVEQAVDVVATATMAQVGNTLKAA